jgi:hypothetical protein
MKMLGFGRLKANKSSKQKWGSDGGGPSLIAKWVEAHSGNIITQFYLLSYGGQ